MPDSKLAVLAILQVGNSFIPIIAFQAAKVGAGNKRVIGMDFKLRLKGPGGVAFLVRGGISAINQKKGNRTGGFRDAAILAVRLHGANGQGDLQASAVGHFFFHRLSGLRRNAQNDRFLPGNPVPIKEGRGAWW